MKTNIINEKGNWAYWSEAQISELKKNATNRGVGDQIVFENDRFTVWSIHLPPGKRLPFHRHDKTYFWTVLTAGKAISYFDDGCVTETEYEIGDTKIFSDLSAENYFIHDLRNAGEETLIFTTVEYN